MMMIDLDSHGNFLLSHVRFLEDDDDVNAAGAGAAPFSRKFDCDE